MLIIRSVVTDGKACVTSGLVMSYKLGNRLPSMRKEAGHEGESRYNTGVESLLLCQPALTHLGWLVVSSLMAC